MSKGSRRAVAYDGEGKIQVIEEAIPELKPGTVLVDVKSSLVSPGTELMFGVCRRRQNPDPSLPPRKFGYGNAGVVVAVGEGCKRLEPGMKVACMGGDALHASHVVVPQNLTIPIPDGVSHDEGAFAHLAATALHSARRGELEFGQHAVVLGLGIVGQINAQIAQLSGAHVIGSDRVLSRLEIARKSGVDLAVNPDEEDLVAKAGEFSHGHGIDAVFMAFGGDATKVMPQILGMLKTSPDTHKMGKIVIVGLAHFEGQFPVDFGNVDIRPSSRPGPGYHDEAWELGRDYPPVFMPWTTQRNMEECLRAVAEKRLLLEPLITHRMPLEEAPAGCEELIQHPDKALGVIFHP